MRNNLRAMATKTMAIIEAGGYRSPAGRDVRIADSIKAAVDGTRLYLPAGEIPAPLPHRVIYSPAVPVFRSDDGTLLDDPFAVSFLTAAAPNLGAITASQPPAAAGVPGVLATRAGRVLAVAAARGHRKLVLGAWGCGVFRNDPAVIAAAFTGELPRARGQFDHVTFAVLDHQRGAPTLAAFNRAVAGP